MQKKIHSELDRWESKEADALEGFREEKNKFIQEQIRPQRRNDAVRFLKKTIEVVILAVLFGGVAGLAFHVVEERAKEYGGAGKPRQMTRSTSGAAEDRKADRDTLTKDLSSLEAYQSLWKNASAVGEQCNRSVVSVWKKQEEGMVSREKSEAGVQSGLIIKETDDSVVILTFDDKLLDAKTARVKFISGQEVSADIARRDDVLGLAVLHVKKKVLSRETRKEYAVIDADYQLKADLHEPILSFGCPDGVLYSVLPGLVTNDGLTAPITDGEVQLYNTNLPYCLDGDGFVSSLRGDWIGIINDGFLDITGKNSCSFLGLMMIYPRIMHLVNGEDIPCMGVVGRDAKEGGRSDAGVYVTEVDYDTPAYEAGLRVADIITSIDSVEIKDLEDLRDSILQSEGGEKLSVEVKRDCGSRMHKKKIQVTLK